MRMLARWTLLCLAGLLQMEAAEWLLIRTTEGNRIEAQAALSSITVSRDGTPLKLRLREVLSVHSGAPASETEDERIAKGIVAIQGKDRKARDLAVEELTAIGVPVVTPLLKALKDTDQHEPRPLYRLFERVMPSNADGFDRSQSLVRLQSGTAVRAKLPDGAIALRNADGTKTSLPWSSVRTIAVRKKAIERDIPVHSLRHSTQIEYLDTGVVLSAGSQLDISADGFARLSWNEDGWASDPNGLTKPGSPAYKSNLFAGHPFGALVGRMGAGAEGPFFIGKKASKTGLPAGRLGLAINDNPHWQNNVGTYTVHLTATDAYDLGDPQ